MREGVCTHDSFIRLYRKTRNAGNQAGAIHDLGRINLIDATRENILAGLDRHDDFFERSITGPFTQTINSTFHLASPIEHR